MRPVSQAGRQDGHVVLRVTGVEVREDVVEDGLHVRRGGEAEPGQPVEGLVDVLAPVLDEPVGEQQQGLVGGQPVRGGS
ncbi:hypothetical protein GCM10020295_17980 [Streptomyces cinereospinus]